MLSGALTSWKDALSTEKGQAKLAAEQDGNVQS